MTKPQEEYMDLAWGLLYDTLSPEERVLALRLAASEPAFLEALQLELALKKELTKLKTPIPEGVKLRVYARFGVPWARRSIEQCCALCWKQPCPKCWAG